MFDGTVFNEFTHIMADHTLDLGDCAQISAVSIQNESFSIRDHISVVGIVNERLKILQF